MIEFKAKDLRDYPLGRLIEDLSHGRAPEGMAKEYHQECERHATERAGGTLVPWQVITGARDLTVGTLNQGGALVGTEVASQPFDVLRNRTVCLDLGGQLLTGLRGQVAFPRKTSTVTAQALAETATLTKSTPSVDQVLLSPHRVGAWAEYSRQLLLQGSVDVEAWLRDDILRTLAVKWDYLMLQGAGANSEPTGILNTPGIGSVLFGGAASWASVISFETALAQQNADVSGGSFAFVATPSVRSKWKQIAKIGSTYPVFIWEDGMVNGYRAAVTNQILNNEVVFGNWNELILGLWGDGIDLTVNPFSRDTDGAIRITCNTFVDVAIRHAASFCWSADSGAQ